MSHIDSPNIPERENTTEPSSSEALHLALKNKQKLIAWVTDPELQKLAHAELMELEVSEKQMLWDAFAIQSAHHEFKSDMKALAMLDSKFSELEGFAQFANLLTSWKLTDFELENLFDFLNQQGRSIKREFEKKWFPSTRTSYQAFADKFGIKTSADLSENSDWRAKSIYLNAIPSLQSIDGNPNVEQLVSMLSDLHSLEWTDAQNQMQQISLFLVGENGQSGKLDAILTALKEQDAENAANGNPTKHFETFTRTVRDFSPDISQRVDLFLVAYEPENAISASANVAYSQAMIDGAIPTGADVQTGSNGSIIAASGDGSSISLMREGDDIQRSIALEGLETAVFTPMEQEDFSKMLGTYEAIQQELSPKLNSSQLAVAFLNNPKFADVPLADMQEGMRKLLWYTGYTKLGIAKIASKAELQALLQTNIAQYQSELNDAERVYKMQLNKAISRNQERYTERDENIKTTLRAIKHSGLGLLDVSYLTTQIKSGFTKVDLGVPVDIQNFDLANSNFWEPHSLSDNQTMHIEYIYRFANKVLTGNPDGMVDGKLVWFSLEQALKNPDVAQKTDGEVKALLKSSGAWNETTGVNKAAVLAQLGRPINDELAT